MSGANEQALRDALAFVAEYHSTTLRDPLLILDQNLRVVSASREFHRTFRVAPRRLRGSSSTSWATASGTSPGSHPPGGGSPPQQHLPRFRGGARLRADRPQGHAAQRPQGLPPHNSSEQILLVIEDVTERRDAEEARREAETRFTEMVKNVRDHADLPDRPRRRHHVLERRRRAGHRLHGGGGHRPALLLHLYARGPAQRAAGAGAAAGVGAGPGRGRALAHEERGRAVLGWESSRRFATAAAG